MAAERRDQLDGGEAGVGHNDQAAIRQPAPGLQDSLTRPVDDRLVPPIVLVAPALGGGEAEPFSSAVAAWA